MHDDPGEASHSRGEFSRNWRALIAPALGVGFGYSLNSYVLSTLAPYVIKDFGWTRAQWAWVAVAHIALLGALPVVGRLADLLGVRRVAAVGAFGYPVTLFALTLLHGNVHAFILLSLVQAAIGSTTVSAVYSRVVAGAFSARRGLALGLFGSSTPLVAAVGAPLLTGVANLQGWRIACLIAAGVSLASAAIVFALLPREPDRPRSGRTVAARTHTAAYRTIFASPVFWIILVATFLVNLPFSFALSQLKIVALAQGLTDATAAFAISAFAVGAIAGRILTGLALDRLPTPLVAATAFSLPAVGALLLASGLGSPAVVIPAVLLIGLSFGGEGDVLPVITLRHFGIELYSSIQSLLSAAIGGALAAGNVLIAATLDATGSFNAYLTTAAVAALTGSVLFAATRRFEEPGRTRPR